MNVGWGEDVSIRELAGLVQEVVGFAGALRFDTSKPDGTPRKLLDVSRLQSHGLGARRSRCARAWPQTYRWFVEHQNDRRG